MAVTSQNGYPVSPELDNRVVPGTDGVKLAPGIAKGDVATVLFYAAARMNLIIEGGHAGWCWGYSYRPIRGATTISNHASATAFDWNAPLHALGKAGTWNLQQVDQLHQLLDDLEGVCRSGAFYNGRLDGMHMEINADRAHVAAVAEKIRNGDKPGGSTGIDASIAGGNVTILPVVAPAVVPAAPSVVEKGVTAPVFPLKAGQYFGPKEPLSNANSVSGYFSHREDLRAWQERMKYRGWKITPDGYYGDESESVAKGFQRDKSLDLDGLIGKDTWRLAWEADITR